MASSALDFLVDEHDFTAPFPRARVVLAGLPPSATVVPHAVHGPVHVRGPVAAPEHAPVPQSPGPLLASSTVLP